jgi:hypothetical protein
VHHGNRYATVSPDSSLLNVELVFAIVVFVVSITAAVQQIWPCFKNEYYSLLEVKFFVPLIHLKCIGTVEYSTIVVRVAYLMDDRD